MPRNDDKFPYLFYCNECNHDWLEEFSRHEVKKFTDESDSDCCPKCESADIVLIDCTPPIYPFGNEKFPTIKDWVVHLVATNLTAFAKLLILKNVPPPYNTNMHIAIHWVCQNIASHVGGSSYRTPEWFYDFCGRINNDVAIEILKEVPAAYDMQDVFCDVFTECDSNWKLPDWMVEFQASENYTAIP